MIHTVAISYSMHSKMYQVNDYLSTYMYTVLLFPQSNLDCFSGSIQYPLPTKKAVASRIGYGGNAIVFVVFHAGKEFAVKKVRLLLF